MRSASTIEPGQFNREEAIDYLQRCFSEPAFDQRHPSIVAIRALLNALLLAQQNNQPTDKIEERLISLAKELPSDAKDLLIHDGLATPIFNNSIELQVFIGEQKHLCIMGSDAYQEEDDESTSPNGHDS